jgi:hypothetical protein
MRTKDEIFDDLSELVWNHFSAKDNQGRSGDDRDTKETEKHWQKYHDLVNEMDFNNKETARRQKRSDMIRGVAYLTILAIMACKIFL